MLLTTKTETLVLVVEDEEPIAETLTTIIDDIGYKPLRAMHGKEAWELAKRYHPSLIITDLMMPYVNGADLIAQLRSDDSEEPLRTIPIILMTAAGMSWARETGADIILRKPFEIEDIENLLQHFLG